ncbi:tripartite tricarboxylate transporter substrate binding protein [Xylophilus sp. GW821-FHT01B05]
MNIPTALHKAINIIFIAVATMPLALHAQAIYPARPIKLVVGFVAGGPSDVLARIIAHELNTSLGQAVIVDNRPGADANIAMETVARSAPDGYTLMLAQSGMTINPAMYSNFKLKPDKDFTLIGMIGEAANVLAVSSSVPARSVAELIDYARKNPGRLNFASSSSPTRLASEMLNSMAGTKIEMVPYKGTPPAITDLLGGTVQVMISSITTFQPQKQDPRLRFLATTGSTRSALLPELPTVSESGLPGYDAVTWYGLAGPANLPAPVAQKLERALAAALVKPEVLRQLGNLSINVTRKNPAEMADFLQRDLAKWTDVVTKSGAKVQ